MHKPTCDIWDVNKIHATCNCGYSHVPTVEQQVDTELEHLAEYLTPKAVLTCVYCGQEYPEGTPPHGSKVLTDHIRVCEKHPMRKLEEENKKLREALWLCQEYLRNLYEALGTVQAGNVTHRIPSLVSTPYARS